MKKFKFIIGVVVGLLVLSTLGAVEKKGNDSEKMFFRGFVWPNHTPGECPFVQSESFTNLYFTGKNTDYYCGDTFYPTWGADGHLYSPFADGTTDGQTAYCADPKSRTGNVVMKGDDPQYLEITNTSTPIASSAYPYGGRYPCGSLMHDSVWYYGTYLLGITKTTIDDDYAFGWPVLGPMPGFRVSTDKGKTWTKSPLTTEEPLFPEPKDIFGAVKMGAPHFVDYGKNMEHSPDGKAYLVAMGAEDDDPMPRFGNLSWVSADQVYLSRVTPSIETINEIKAYEFFAGHDDNGKAIWTNDFSEIKPLLEWNNHMGCVTVTYNAPLKKYFMCVTDGWRTRSNMDSYILEADDITGPWKMLTYMKEFGTQAYFLNFPSKFISDDGKTMWLCYSGNYGAHRQLPRNPPHGRYGLCLYEVKLVGDDKQQLEASRSYDDPLNVARKAKVTVSSTQKGTTSEVLVDGLVCNHKEGVSNHWLANDKGQSWIKFEWDSPQYLRALRLYNCTEKLDQEKFGYVEFSNGRKIPIRCPLPNTDLDGLDIYWGNKEKVDWIKLVFDKVKPAKEQVSLSEVAIFSLPLKDIPTAY